MFVKNIPNRKFIQLEQFIKLLGKFFITTLTFRGSCEKDKNRLIYVVASRLNLTRLFWLCNYTTFTADTVAVNKASGRSCSVPLGTWCM